MREWIFASLPVGLVIYFLFYPAKFQAMLQWLVAVFR